MAALSYGGPSPVASGLDSPKIYDRSPSMDVLIFTQQ